MLSKIVNLKISTIFIFSLAVLCCYISSAQQKTSNFDYAIQEKISYNKKIAHLETCSLEGLIFVDSHSSVVSRKAAVKDLDNLNVFELQTDTVILIQAETKSLYNLIDEKFDELKFDDKYFQENFYSQDQTRKVSIFTNIHKTIRILFIKLNDNQFCIID